MQTLPRHNPGAAVTFMVTAALFIAGTMLSAKALGTDLLGPDLHPLQVTWGRFAFAWIVIAGFVGVTRPSLVRPHIPLHIGRTLLGFSGVTLMFASVAFIPLSDATAISFLNPVFGMLFAVPLLGERVGPIRWTAAAIALAGAMILLRPSTDSLQAGALFALGAAMILGLEVIFIKRLSGRESPLQILFLNNSLGLIVSSSAVLFVWQAPSPGQWAVLALLGALMAAAQACFVNAMARAEASFVTPFSYLTLVFAAGLDFLVFQARPDWISLLGAATILAGAVLLALREAQLARHAARSRQV